MHSCKPVTFALVRSEEDNDVICKCTANEISSSHLGDTHVACNTVLWEKVGSKRDILKCDLCRMPFVCELELHKHEAAHGLPPNLKCLCCTMSYLDYESLITHCKSHKHYQCSQCPLRARLKCANTFPASHIPLMRS